MRPIRLAPCLVATFTASIAAAQPGATPPSSQTWSPPAAPAPAPAPSTTPPPPPPAPYAQPYAPAPATYPAPTYGYGQPYGGYPQGYPHGGYLTRPAQDFKPAKNPGTATLLSLGVTALGFGMFLSALEDDDGWPAGWLGLGTMLVGPSAGHIYAGESGHAVKMSLLRTAGLATLVWGAVEADSYEYDCYDYDYYCEEDDNNGEAAMWIGGAVLVGATLYDFVDAGRSAQRANERQRRAWTVTPSIMGGPAGRSPGLALTGQF